MTPGADEDGVDAATQVERPGGDSSTFESWYRAEWPRLVAVLVRLGATREEAADAAAEACCRALERWNRVAMMRSPSGWTYQVAFNALKRSARRSTLERRATAAAGMRSGDDPDRDRDVWEAVQRLPRRQSAAVVLHYLLDLPYRDVAASMEISGSPAVSGGRLTR